MNAKNEAIMNELLSDDDKKKMLDEMDRKSKRQIVRAIKGKKKYGYK